MTNMTNMKLDPDCVRKILLTIKEKKSTGYNILKMRDFNYDGYGSNMILDHVKRLIRKKYIEGEIEKNASVTGREDFTIRGMTDAGREYLEKNE